MKKKTQFSTYKEKTRRMTGYQDTTVSMKTTPLKRRIMVGLPMTGIVRSEWMLAKYGQVIPCNWSQYENFKFIHSNAPINYLVADARNLIVQDCLAHGAEWLFFIDSDVVLPPQCTLAMGEYIRKGNVPIVGGIYFTKSFPSEPLIYRGLGNSFYDKWHFGDKVWVTGIGMGCTLIHSSILQVLYDNSEEYSPAEGESARKVFETPQRITFDGVTSSFLKEEGTEDLFFLNRLHKEDVFKKAGWGSYTKKEFPVLCDTSIFCYHIDINGVKYPANGEYLEFVKKGTVKKFKKSLKKGF